MKTLVLMGLMIWSVSGTALSMGWRGSPEPQTTSAIDQPYDVSKEIAFEGKVLRIDPPPCVATPLYSYHILLQGAQDIVEVHLGPCDYAAQQKPELRVGDQIRGVGAVANWRSGSRRVINAREIRRGKDLLRFRDTSGNPLWRD